MGLGADAVIIGREWVLFCYAERKRDGAGRLMTVQKVSRSQRAH